jgi:glycosyltransferase involved in cell wall biosynthesis
MSGPSILFLSIGADQAPTRYRALAYFPLLRAAGWQPEHRAIGPGWGTRVALLRAVRRAEVTVVLRKTITALWRTPLRRAARRLVLDFDDAVFVRDDGSPSWTRARRFAAMVRRCDAVWAGNAYLGQAAGRYGPHVAVLPTSVDPSLYPPQAEKPADHVDLVWIGSSATRKYLEQALPALAAAAGAVPALRLTIVADFALPAAPLPTVAVPWSAAGEAQALAQAHIGIAPMPDDPWTRGKCGLKVLQYLAAGLPVVASDAGVHRELIAPGRTGLLAGNPEQWVAALTTLAADPALRRRLGAAGREAVIERYSVQATGAILLAELRRLTAQP